MLDPEIILASIIIAAIGRMRGYGAMALGYVATCCFPCAKAIASNVPYAATPFGILLIVVPSLVDSALDYCVWRLIARRKSKAS